MLAPVQAERMCPNECHVETQNISLRMSLSEEHDLAISSPLCWKTLMSLPAYAPILVAFSRN